MKIDKDIESSAELFATLAHQYQKRKYTNEPYIVHPRAVVQLVKSVKHDKEMVAASWLHDVVEDCEVSFVTIANLFGEDVAKLVSDLTDVSNLSDGNRKIRKDIDRAHTSSASPRAKTIKLADLIDNSKSIVKHDIKFAKIFLEEKRRLLEVLKEGDSTLWNDANAQLHNSTIYINNSL